MEKEATCLNNKISNGTSQGSKKKKNSKNNNKPNKQTNQTNQTNSNKKRRTLEAISPQFADIFILGWLVAANFLPFQDQILNCFMYVQGR